MVLCECSPLCVCDCLCHKEIEATQNGDSRKVEGNK